MSKRDDLIADLLPRVRQAARTVSVYWPETIDADDVEQEIAVRLLEADVRWLEALADSPAAGIVTVLKRAGMQVAAGYRDDFELFSGNYFYSGDEVRRLLADGALVFGDELTCTERADLARAMSQLAKASPQYHDVLVRRYALDEANRADKDVLSRAVRALTREMNRSFNRARVAHEGPALRREQ